MQSRDAFMGLLNENSILRSVLSFFLNFSIEYYRSPNLV
jgi:hypothetical protein